MKINDVFDVFRLWQPKKKKENEKMRMENREEEENETHKMRRENVRFVFLVLSILRLGKWEQCYLVTVLCF